MTPTTPFQEYLLLVPEGAREKVAAILETQDLSTPDGVAEAARALTVAVIRGHLPPEIAETAGRFLEVGLKVAAIKGMAQPGGAGSVLHALREGAAVRATIMEVSRRALPDHRPPVLDATAVPAAVATGGGK